MCETFIERGADIKAIDAAIRNKFKWSWLEEEDSLGNFLSDYIRKIPDPGFCYCLICKRRLCYGSKGKSFLVRHAETTFHKSLSEKFKESQTFSAMVFNGLDDGVSCVTKTSGPSRPYGAAPNVLPDLSKDVSKKRKIESDSPTPHHHHNSSSQHQRQQQDVKVEGEEGEGCDDDHHQQEQQEPSTSSDNNNLLSDLDLSHTIEEAVPVPESQWWVPIKHEPEVEVTSSLEARLQYLETREVAMTRDIIRLKTENVELRTQLLDGVADNSQLQLSLKKLERKCAKLEGDLMEICGLRDGIEDLDEGLRRLEDRMKDVKDMEGRLKSCEPPEITSSNQLTAPKPNHVDQGGDSFSSEIEAMKNSIKALEHMNTQYSQSVVDVELWPCEKMEPNTAVKLNKCVGVFKNHRVFQTSECVLHPETDGDYLMCVVYRQSGLGSVSMTARVDGEEGGRHFGQTGNDGKSLESCCSQVMRLVQGQRVWLEAIGDRGDPAIDMCRFYCRLIGM